MNLPPAARIFLAYAPRGVGLRCAVAYLARGHNAYGWFTGARNFDFSSDYFALEDFYTPRETRYVAVSDADLHSGWLNDEALCHELAGMQEAFRREWLFSRSDPNAQAQLDRYAEAELAAGEVAIRFDRLGKLSKLQPNWTWYSRDFERGVLDCLARHWPLDYGADDEA